MLARFGRNVSRTFPEFAHPGSQCISSRIDEAVKRWTSAGENVKREFLQVVDKGLEAGSGRKWHSCPGCRKITLGRVRKTASKRIGRPMKVAPCIKTASDLDLFRREIRGR
jgi:hypothetical protein